MSAKQTYIVFSIACMVAFILFPSKGVATKAEQLDSSISRILLASTLILNILNSGLVIWGLGKKPFPIPISIVSILLAVGGVASYNFYNAGIWSGYNIRIDMLFTMPLAGFNLALGLFSGYQLMIRLSSEPPPPS